MHRFNPPTRALRTAVRIALFALTLLGPRAALAEWTVKRPGAHPDYVFEAEPHPIASVGVSFLS